MKMRPDSECVVNQLPLPLDNEVVEAVESDPMRIIGKDSWHPFGTTREEHMRMGFAELYKTAVDSTEMDKVGFPLYNALNDSIEFILKPDVVYDTIKENDFLETYRDCNNNIIGARIKRIKFLTLTRLGK